MPMLGNGSADTPVDITKNLIVLNDSNRTELVYLLFLIQDSTVIWDMIQPKTISSAFFVRKELVSFAALIRVVTLTLLPTVSREEHCVTAAKETRKEKNSDKSQLG